MAVEAADTRLAEETAALSPQISQSSKGKCCRSSWVAEEAAASPHLLDMAVEEAEVLPPSMPELPNRSSPAVAVAVADTAAVARSAPVAVAATEEMAFHSISAGSAALAESADSRGLAVPHQLTPILLEDSPDTAPPVEMAMAALAAPAAGLAVIKEAAAESALEPASVAPKEMMEACVLPALISRPWRAVAVAVTAEAAQG